MLVIRTACTAGLYPCKCISWQQLQELWGNSVGYCLWMQRKLVHTGLIAVTLALHSPANRRSLASASMSLPNSSIWFQATCAGQQQAWRLAVGVLYPCAAAVICPSRVECHVRRCCTTMNGYIQHGRHVLCCHSVLQFTASPTSIPSTWSKAVSR